MKISVDGGGLPRKSGYTFGTAIFSGNLLSALTQFDKNNLYFVYTIFKDQVSIVKKRFFFQKIVPKQLWMKLRIPFEELFNPKHVFLALNQAVPLYTSGKVISFSHGLSFYFFKNLYKGSYGRFMAQLNSMLKKSQTIVVSSKRVAAEMETIFPKYKEKIVVIPFGIPYDMQTYSKTKKEPFFMFVGMNHAVKNVPLLVKVFQEFIEKAQCKNFKLYLVGPFENYSTKNIICFPLISRKHLRDMYRKSSGYISLSVYESFNFPALEALTQRCPVIGIESAIIPEMAEFVYIAKNKDECISYMQMLLQGNYPKFNFRKLETVFSWAKYVKILLELYK